MHANNRSATSELAQQVAEMQTRLELFYPSSCELLLSLMESNWARLLSLSFLSINCKQFLHTIRIGISQPINALTVAKCHCCNSNTLACIFFTSEDNTQTHKSLIVATKDHKTNTKATIWLNQKAQASSQYIKTKMTLIREKHFLWAASY